MVTAKKGILHTQIILLKNVSIYRNYVPDIRYILL